MGALGARWGELEDAAPELAAAGRRLLEDEPGTPVVAFLGTVGSDGIPRIHPFIPAVVGDELWALLIPSPKRRDLDRSRSFAIHSSLGADDESFTCAGTAERIDDRGARLEVVAAMPYTEIDDEHVLYRFRLARALWTTWSTPTTPVHRTWTWNQKPDDHRSVEAEVFAREWLDAWNSHDLERVLSHYAPDARVTSPVAARRVAGSGGTVVGHAALAAYWRPVLAPGSALRFELVEVLRTVDGATIIYRNQDGQTVAETVRWNAQGLVTEALVSYGRR